MRILINGLTLEEGNLIPLLLKVKVWQKKGSEVWILGNRRLKEKINKLKILKKKFSFIKLESTSRIKGKFSLIDEGLKRNLRVLTFLDDYRNFDTFDGAWFDFAHHPEPVERKLCPLGQNKQAPLSINPEHTPAFKPESRRIDLVYSISSVLDLIIFPFFLKIKNKKIKWATVFDNIVPLNDPGNKIIRFLAWLFFQLSLILLRKADYIFVISGSLNDFLIKKCFDKRKIIFTGNAVETDLIKKAQKKKKYSYDAVFTGRINETKGIDDLLNVLEIVRKPYPSFKLAIMGRGDRSTEKKYHKEIKKRQLEKNIKFLGYKTGLEKFEIIKSSKMFLFLSKSQSESFGISLLEAVCCGIPAIAYDLPAYQEIYKNHEVFFFTKNDYQKVAKKVIEIMDKKIFFNKKGEGLLNKYPWDKIAVKEYQSFSFGIPRTLRR